MTSPANREVYRNLFTLKVNGQTVTVDNFMVGDTPYVPLVDVAELLGMDVTYDLKSRTAAATNKPSATQVTRLSTMVDPFKPSFDLTAMGLTPGMLNGVGLEVGGSLVPVPYWFAGDRLTIGDHGSGLALELNRNYVLNLFARNKTSHRVEFTTAGLPELTSTGQRRVIFVPAMPEKGFHWPYFLALPSDRYKAENQQAKRHLVVDITNTGVSNDVSEMLRKTRSAVDGRQMLSLDIAEELWAPALIAAFPRPNITYYAGGMWHFPYTHSLDRTSATLHMQHRDPAMTRLLDDHFTQAGFTVPSLLHIDRQVVAMIDHAVSYLNQYGHHVQPQAFLVGYSASGTFTDRLATLHPQKVKAVATGATNDDVMLPLASHGGEQLIFPIGTADFREITGRAFDLKAHNQVARLIFMGENDTNNTVPYDDSYGAEERRIIVKLWGLEVLPRAHKLAELYGQAGGKAMFVLDRGTAHGYSLEMYSFIKTFLQANRDSAGPVYPLPPRPEALPYTLHK